MKRISILLIIVFSIFGCQNKEPAVDDKKKSIEEKSNFEMYKMTELAMLMEQMYSYNLQLRTRIIEKGNLGEFPERFNKIYSATMTDPSDNDLFFQQHAKLYIEAQKAIYSNPENAQENFNEMVQSCLNCHAKKCGGPISRIKKLFIN